jgi:hypothetical protein
MKPTEFIVENSIIAQEADDMHRDHEVQMARSQMYSAAQAAIEIHRLLRDVSEMEGLEGWVQSKLTLASQYLESVRDYMKYEAVSQEPEMMVFAEGAAEYAIESLLAEEDDDFMVRKPGGDYIDPEKGYAASRYRDRIMSAPKGEINPGLQRYAERNIPSNLGDEGLPGAKRTGPSGPKGAGVRDFTQGGQTVGGSSASRVERPEGVPRVSKIPATRFGGGGVRPSGGGGGGGGGGGMSMFDLANRRFRPMQYEDKQSVKESATGGASSAGAVATSMAGPGHKPTSGVPKKVGNSYKSKKVAVGKGVYDK